MESISIQSIFHCHRTKHCQYGIFTRTFPAMKLRRMLLPTYIHMTIERIPVTRLNIHIFPRQTRLLLNYNEYNGD